MPRLTLRAALEEIVRYVSPGDDVALKAMLDEARAALAAPPDTVYVDGLRAAALIAERMRDSYYQRGRATEASVADEVRHRIQYEIDNPLPVLNLCHNNYGEQYEPLGIDD